MRVRLARRLRRPAPSPGKHDRPPTAFIGEKQQSTGNHRRSGASGEESGGGGKHLFQHGLRAVVVIPWYASARVQHGRHATDVRRGDFLGCYMDSKRPTAVSKLDRQIPGRAWRPTRLASGQRAAGGASRERQRLSQRTHRSGDIPSTRCCAKQFAASTRPGGFPV